MFTALAIVGLSLLGADLSEPAKKELATLQGKWVIERIDSSDVKYEHKPGENEIVVEFKEEKLLVNGNEVADIVGVFPENNPRCLDIQRKEGGDGKPDEGVYKLDGDALLLNLYVGGGAKERPINFEVPTKAGTVLVTMKKK